MRRILFLLFLLCVSSFATTFNQDTKIVIAHAGGAINGIRYLNSKEAVQQSIQRGFSYIELDLLETPDGDLVAAHDWKTFHKLTGYPSQTEPIPAREARKRKILNEQTVLTSKEIREIFTKYTDLYLVTDKINNIPLLKNKFAGFVERIIVELKFPEECRPDNINPISYCASLFKKELITSNTTQLLFTEPLREIEKNKKWFRKHPKVQLLVYTVNDIPTAQKLLHYPFVKGIYSDFLSPRILQDIK